MKKCFILLALLNSPLALAQYDDLLKKRLNELAPVDVTHYLITKDIKENNAEQAAVSAFSWGGPENNKNLVGGALRAYSESITGNGAWGADLTVIGGPNANVMLVGAEIGLYQRSHKNQRHAIGINTIFGNRLGGEVPILGENKYNENAWAWFVSAWPRGPSGEYSGWNKVIHVYQNSLDRTKTVPYSAIIDLQKQRSEVPLYLVVYQCGITRCGVRLTEIGLELWQDVDGAAFRKKVL